MTFWLDFNRGNITKFDDDRLTLYGGLGNVLSLCFAKNWVFSRMCWKQRRTIFPQFRFFRDYFIHNQFFKQQHLLNYSDTHLKIKNQSALILASLFEIRELDGHLASFSTSALSLPLLKALNHLKSRLFDKETFPWTCNWLSVANSSSFTQSFMACRYSIYHYI